MVGTRYTRRDLLQAACVAGMSIVTPQLLAVEEEGEAKKKAKFELRFASPYDSADWRTTPHMHQQIKKEIEHYSKGEIFVSILDKGIAGIGPDLMKRVSHGYVSAALISASNLSPVAPVLDVLNIPFWSADNQNYLNLITSSIWQQEVESNVKQRGLIEVLFPYVVGARTITTTRRFNQTLIAPKDLSGRLVRIPSSKVLQNFYNIVEAKPIRIPWGKTSKEAQKGSFEVLDPSVVGLYSGPDSLRQHLGVINRLDTVQDSWVAVVNQVWMSKLPSYLQEAVKYACSEVFKQQISGLSTVTDNCLLGLKEAGVQLYQPSIEEKAQWVECCGHEHASWAAIKRNILKDEKTFPKLLAATQENNGFSLSK